MPLVTEAYDWAHGVFLARTSPRRGTAAAESKVGELRRDPFAMLPFCGYNMGDYFGHWLSRSGAVTDPAKLPRIYFVNWFRKDADGKFVWPGFGENSRVLKWICERLAGEAEATDTPIGRVPAAADLDTERPGAHRRRPGPAADGGRQTWLQEAEHTREYFGIFGSHLPGPAVGGARVAAGAAEGSRLTPVNRNSRQ